jgi:hypothetical protein
MMMNVNPIKAQLEALDQKAGRVHTMDDWRRVGELSQRTPEALTDDDLVILAYFAGEKDAARALARRTQARTPPTPAPATKAIETAPPSPPRADNSHDGVKVKADTADFDVAAFLARHGADAVTFKWLFKREAHVVSEILEEFKSQMARIKELERRLVAQDAALAALKAVPTLKDAGIWRHGSSYTLGDVAQFKGSPWICTQAHVASGTPDHACWRLWLKSSHNGKDGKDVRP